MTMFGVSENDVVPVLTAVAGRDLDRDAWSGIAEPGDRLAGVIVRSLGAVEALRTVMTGVSARALSVRLRGAGDGADAVGAPRVGDEGGSAAPGDEQQVAEALARWRPRLDPAAAVRSLQQAARVDARLLVPADPLFPAGVDDLGDHAPIALLVR